jgi:hypothetical protein
MNTAPIIQNTQNTEGPGFFKNIVNDVGRAGLNAGLQIPGLVFKELSNRFIDIGVYLVGIPTQGLEQNENVILEKVKEIVLKLDDIDNKLGDDEQLLQLRKKITERFIHVVAGSVDDLVNNPKLHSTLNNLLDKLNRSGINTAKVFITGAKDIVLEVPGLGAAVAIVDTGTKAVIAGSSILSSLIAMAETGAIVAKTTNESIQKIVGVINEFSIPSPNINQMAALPTIDEMREKNKMSSNISHSIDNMQPNGVPSQLPSINEMRQRNNMLGGGGARYLKTITRRKNSIEKRINGSIGKFMNNKLTKKRRRHQKYTQKRYAR